MEQMFALLFLGLLWPALCSATVTMSKHSASPINSALWNINKEAKLDLTACISTCQEFGDLARCAGVAISADSGLCQLGTVSEGKSPPGEETVNVFIQEYAKWSGWSIWSDCTVTCEGGTQSRSRECLEPVSPYSGPTCSGEAREKQDCNTMACPVSVVSFFGGKSETGWVYYQEPLKGACSDPPELPSYPGSTAIREHATAYSETSMTMYTCGGLLDNVETDRCFSLQTYPAASNWVELPRLPRTFRRHSLALYETESESFLFALGGFGKDIHYLDLKADGAKWSTGPKLDKIRQHLSLVSGGPELYIIGGVGSEGTSEDVLFYNLAYPENAPKVINQLASGPTFKSSCVLIRSENRKILCVNGLNGIGESATRSNTLQILELPSDPMSTESWPKWTQLKSVSPSLLNEPPLLEIHSDIYGVFDEAKRLLYQYEDEKQVFVETAINLNVLPNGSMFQKILAEKC